MQKPSGSSIIFLFAGLLLLSLACSLTGGEEPSPTPEAELLLEATPEPSPTTEPETVSDSLAVTSLDDLDQAVVQIVAEGSFVDPEFGLQLNIAGAGSGFIIDPQGIAVTNNHVVTGAALLRVYVAGETEPRNARVLGVSECSDLAVIDLEGDGYPYLEWYAGAISTGLEVYAAGFPLGDPEFTLTRGIVAKEDADGETWWASVDRVLMHDAIINPGNSGGPLVTADAQVVGVNYRTRAENQYLAIARSEALKVLDALRIGQDVDSIGVNGMAVNDGESLSGIWVSSVKSGSQADRAGVRGGDIITMMEGLVLATDGTMSDYCDILRSHAADDTLGLEVLRYETQEVLEGQLNGDELAVAFSFASEIENQVGENFADEGEAAYTDYIQVTDATETLTVEIPTAWSADVDGEPLYDDDGEFLTALIQASSDLEAFWGTYSTPGVAFYASEVLAQQHDAASLLDTLAEEYDCVYDGRKDYDDGVYKGLYDLYVDCGQVGSAIVELAAFPDHGGFATYLVIQAVSDADFEALDHILNTFYVIEEE